MKKGVGMWAQHLNPPSTNPPHPLPDRISTPWPKSIFNAAINVMFEGGGVAQDDVGTLILRTHPTWGILAKFEQKGWPQDRKV